MKDDDERQRPFINIYFAQIYIYITQMDFL